MSQFQLSFQGKKVRIPITESFKEMKQRIVKAYPQLCLTKKWHISYFDQIMDEISVDSEEQYNIFRNDSSNIPVVQGRICAQKDTSSKQQQQMIQADKASLDSGSSQRQERDQDQDQDQQFNQNIQNPTSSNLKPSLAQQLTRPQQTKSKLEKALAAGPSANRPEQAYIPSSVKRGVLQPERPVPAQQSNINQLDYDQQCQELKESPPQPSGWQPFHKLASFERQEGALIKRKEMFHNQQFDQGAGRLRGISQKPQKSVQNEPEQQKPKNPDSQDDDDFIPFAAKHQSSIGDQNQQIIENEHKDPLSIEIDQRNLFAPSRLSNSQRSQVQQSERKSEIYSQQQQTLQRNQRNQFSEREEINQDNSTRNKTIPIPIKNQNNQQSQSLMLQNQRLNAQLQQTRKEVIQKKECAFCNENGRIRYQKFRKFRLCNRCHKDYEVILRKRQFD